jgi:GNAT superfamily N-acetyltransferase
LFHCIAAREAVFCVDFVMDPAAVNVRLATTVDLAAVRACVEAAYTPYIEEIGVTPRPLGDDYAALIGDGRVWVAVHGDEIVGVLVLFIEPDHILIDNYAVAPAWQSRGISRQFNALAHREGRRRGITTFRLYTHAKMTRNRELYRRRGWVEIERREDDGFDRVFMERRLGDDEGWD